MTEALFRKSHSPRKISETRTSSLVKRTSPMYLMRKRRSGSTVRGSHPAIADASFFRAISSLSTPAVTCGVLLTIYGIRTLFRAFVCSNFFRRYSCRPIFAYGSPPTWRQQTTPILMRSWTLFYWLVKPSIKFRAYAFLAFRRHTCRTKNIEQFLCTRYTKNHSSATSTVLMLDRWITRGDKQPNAITVLQVSQFRWESIISSWFSPFRCN